MTVARAMTVPADPGEGREVANGAPWRRVDMAGTCSLGLYGDPAAQAAALARAVEPYEVRASRTGHAGDGEPLEPDTAPGADTAQGPDAAPGADTAPGLGTVPGDATVPPDVLLAWSPRGTLAWDEIQGDTGDGRIVARRGREVFLLAGDASCSIPEPLVPHARVDVSGAFPLRRLLADVAWPAVQHAALRHDGLVAHASAVSIGSRGLLIGGWSESGKTELALGLLELGAAFVSDKWTVLTPAGDLAAFPSRITLRPWTMPFLPRLRATMRGARRVRLLAAMSAERALPVLEHGARRLPLGEVLVPAVRRGGGLAARVPLAHDVLVDAYGGAATSPFRVAVSLVRTPVGAPAAREVDGVGFARRLASSAAYERGAYWSLARRRDHLVGSGSMSAQEAEHEIVLAETGRLERALSDARVLEVRAPFGIDPRRVADVVLPWL